MTRDTVIAERIEMATTFWARLRGLMGRSGLPPGSGLYLATTSIHMLFMRFPIDALFVGPADDEQEHVVLRARSWLSPWSGLVLPVRGAIGVVEMTAGALRTSGTQVGDRVRFEAPV